MGVFFKICMGCSKKFCLSTCKLNVGKIGKEERTKNSIGPGDVKRSFSIAEF